MAKLNLKAMSARDLIDLRTRVDAILSAKVKAERKTLETSLQRLERFGGGKVRKGRKTHPFAGKKVAPKYRGPNGKTWTGRGLKPRWMAEALKGGKKVEDFLIANGGKGRRAAKR